MLYSMGYPPKKVKKPKHFLLDSRSFAVPHSGRGGGGMLGVHFRWDCTVGLSERPPHPRENELILSCLILVYSVAK